MSKPVDPTIDSQNVITPNPSTTSSTRHSSRKAVLCPTLLLIVSLGLFALYARSYTYLNQDLGTWGCRMSWMAPNYVKMDGPEVESGLGRKYGVFLYREGGLQGDIRVSSELNLGLSSSRPMSPSYGRADDGALSFIATRETHPLYTRERRFLKTSQIDGFLCRTSLSPRGSAASSGKRSGWK